MSRLEQTEEFLRLAQKRYALAVRAGRVGVWDWDVYSGDVFLCRNLKTMLGYEEHEVPDRLHAWIELMHPEDRDSFRAVARKCIEGRAPAFEIEHRLCHRNGDVRWYLTRGSAEADGWGEPRRIVGTTVDVTERRAAEEARRRSEALELHSEVLMSLAEGVNYLNAEGIICFTNPAFDTMFGYERGELLGQHVSVLNDFGAEENTQLIDEMMTTVRSLGTWSGTIRNRRKDGTPFSTSARVSPLRGHHDACFVTVQEDVTWRQQMEAALRDSESRFRAIFEQSPDGIVLLDPETTRAIQFNEAAYRSLGYTHEEFAGLRVCDYEAIESCEEIARHAQKLLSEGAGRFETRHRSKDGHLSEVLVNAKVIELGGKNLILSVFRDLTEQRRTEDTLRQNKQRYRALLEAVPDLLFRIRSDGMYLEYKSAKGFAEFRPPSELLGKRVSEVLPADVAEVCMNQIARALATGDVVSYECELPMKDGPRQYETRLVGIKTDEVMAIVRDVTKAKHTERCLRKLQDELAHVTRLSTLGEMASALAHELNQPLTAIVGYLDAGLGEIRARQSDAGKLSTVMEGAASEAMRAGQIIRRLRNLVRPASTQDCTANLNDLVQEVLALATPELRSHSIKVQLDLAQPLPPVPVDRIQIEQVILNLIRNAMEAMLTTDVSRRLLTLQTRLLEGEKVQLGVADTGAGLDPTVAPRLFDPFVTTKDSGMGMGLAISKNIVEAHEGTIWAEPNPAGGMVFRFVLPVSRGAENAVETYRVHRG